MLHVEHINVMTVFTYSGRLLYFAIEYMFDSMNHLIMAITRNEEMYTMNCLWGG
jgi:hypothetical protein